MEGRGDEDFSPGDFYSVHGAPVFGEAVWNQMRELNRGLPAMSDLPALRAREAVRFQQDSAPLDLLQRFPSAPELRQDLLLGVVTGSLPHEIQAIDACLRAWFASEAPVRPVATEAVVPIELLLDSFDVPTWVGFGRYQESLALLLDGSEPMLLDAGHLS